MHPWLWRIAVALLLAAAVYLIYRLIRRYRECWPPEPNENGIRVGAPKVYDNRSLSLMLEQLQEQLRNVQSIDAGTLTASIGSQQGERRTSLGGSLDATVTGPAVKLEAGKKTAADKDADDGGAPEKSSPASKEDGWAAPSTTASPLKWSERTADLLGDQMNLSYEIFNLRLLLERAISDRLLGHDTRVQAVIGIPISIDPPPYAAGCAATVEVRLTAPANVMGPSLVAMFPQQETYNTWGVDRRSFRVGAGGTAPAATLSGQTTAQSESSSLHRYIDTVAIERESGENELIIAWQFRPSAGERTVSSGLRQMLAVLALSSADEGEHSFSLNVAVRSSWQHWDQSTQTAGAGVGWRALFSNRPTYHGVWGAHGSVEVPTTEQLEQDLRPEIAKIEWLRVGPTKAGVVITGTNFFAGTTVVMGDGVLGAESGLTIKSERSLQLVVPLSSLLTDALLNGRYGSSMKLLNPVDPQLQLMRIREIAIEPAENNLSFRVTVWLETRDGSVLDRTIFDQLPDPIFTINGEVIPEMLVFSNGDTASSVMGAVRVTAKYIPSNSVFVGVLWPFYGDNWSLHYQTYEPKKSLAVARVRGEATTTLLLSGETFDNGVKVIVNGPYTLDPAGPLRRITDDLLQLDLSNEVADQYEQIYLAQPNVPTVAVPVEAAKRRAAPSIDKSSKPPTLAPGASGVLEYAGSGLDTVTAVTLDGHALAFSAYAGGAAMSVAIEGSLIPAAGLRELLFAVPRGAALKGALLVVGG